MLGCLRGDANLTRLLFGLMHAAKNEAGSSSIDYM
jgi:hypothetical protein